MKDYVFVLMFVCVHERARKQKGIRRSVGLRGR